MKIAIITNYWKNSNGGGIKTYLVNLVDTLSNKKADVSVLFREGRDSNHYCGGKNKILFSLRCYRHLRKIRPEIIHSQGTWYCLLPGVLYKKIHSCNLVHTFHTEPQQKLPKFERRFFSFLLSSCDTITFVSKKLQHRIEDIDSFSFPRTAITYAGVSSGEVLDEEIERFRRQHNIEKDAIILLAQAMTAHRQKANGLKLLIQAVRMLTEKYPNILLIATREGIYSEEMRAFAQESGIEERVIFTGNIENPYVPLEMCNLFTHISLSDGLPMALLEAMVMGKPIVATDVGGIPEAISNGQNGLLVAPVSEVIAQKIDWLLQNSEIAEDFGRQAKKTVEERFTWELAAERFMQCYSNKDEMR